MVQDFCTVLYVSVLLDWVVICVIYLNIFCMRAITTTFIQTILKYKMYEFFRSLYFKAVTFSVRSCCSFQETLENHIAYFIIMFNIIAVLLGEKCFYSVWGIFVSLKWGCMRYLNAWCINYAGLRHTTKQDCQLAQCFRFDQQQNTLQSPKTN